MWIPSAGSGSRIFLNRFSSGTPSDRPAFLAQVAAGDDELLREVESLLEHVSVPVLIDRPMVEAAAAMFVDADGLKSDAGVRPDRVNHQFATEISSSWDPRRFFLVSTADLGAKVEDWEDIAVGPCPQGSCIYIADVGDNTGNRDHVMVYRVPEPSPQDSSTAPTEVFRARYAGGAHDAEALFVTPKSEVFISTKAILDRLRYTDFRMCFDPT